MSINKLDNVATCLEYIEYLEMELYKAEDIIKKQNKDIAALHISIDLIAEKVQLAVEDVILDEKLN